MLGFPEAATETAQEFDQQIVNSAENPLFVIPKPSDANVSDPQLSKAVQTCLEMKAHGKAQ